MGRESDLLRMLEPAVRPGGLTASPRPTSRPIEDKDFESLLAEATAGRTAESQPPPQDQPARGPDPLRSLAGTDRIENASLRQLVAGAATPARPAA